MNDTMRKRRCGDSGCYYTLLECEARIFDRVMDVIVEKVEIRRECEGLNRNLARVWVGVM